jgi:hypothetical protein
MATALGTAEVAQQLKVNEKKWTPTLMKAGWTALPNVLFERQQALGLDAIDINIINGTERPPVCEIRGGTWRLGAGRCRFKSCRRNQRTQDFLRRARAHRARSVSIDPQANHRANFA